MQKKADGEHVVQVKIITAIAHRGQSRKIRRVIWPVQTSLYWFSEHHHSRHSYSDLNTNPTLRPYGKTHPDVRRYQKLGHSFKVLHFTTRFFNAHDVPACAFAPGAA